VGEKGRGRKNGGEKKRRTDERGRGKRKEARKRGRRNAR
jgi:hypothetical protein